MAIKISYMVLGSVMTNCYFLQNPGTSEMILVDPADRADAIADTIEKEGGKPVAILLTHGHFDHILAADTLREKYGCQVIAYESETALLNDPMLNLSGMWDKPFTLQADRTVADGEHLTIAGYEIEVMHTPGHTSGSCCFYLPEEKVLLSGDTLFCQSCGRTDFPTSSIKDMQNSLARLLNHLPDDVRVLPGHNEMTTIGDEKRWNPFAPR